MVIKDRGCRKTVGKLLIAGSFLLASGLAVDPASAMVTGRCDNCHTMHASQNGLDNTEVHINTAAFPASWSGGVLAGGDPAISVPPDRLLKTNCVGCHSNTGTDTIVTLAGMKVPIVYNTGGYPAGAAGTANHPLAGGNFWGVADAGGNNDSWGHNVGGISGQDGILSKAPGDSDEPTCNSQSCHANLAEPDATTPAFLYSAPASPPVPQGNFNGCKGCHNKVGHHTVEVGQNTSYRYLGGHGGGGIDKVHGGAAAVAPATNSFYEDPDWEQTNGAGDHNKYQNQTDPMDFTSIGRFCAGCHGKFHAMGTAAGEYDPVFGTENGGDPNTDDLIVKKSIPVNPWMRHPTNVNLPLGDLDGEYSQLDGLPYSPLTPVAQDPGGNWNQIDTGDQVMCLSCHRAHASDQPDALRFAYSGMQAHNSAGSTAGCFFCHRTKDE